MVGTVDQRWGKATIQILVVLALILGAVVLFGSKMLVTMAGDGEHIPPTSVGPSAVSVSVNGTKKTVQTSAVTVGGLVRELGVQKESRLSAPLAAKLSSLDIPLNISTPKSLTLLVDGTRAARTTTAPDVEDFLTESDVVLGQHDTLSVPESSAVFDGMSIKVSGVELDRQVRATEVLPFTTKKVSDSRFDRGEEKTVRPGENGEVP